MRPTSAEEEGDAREEGCSTRAATMRKKAEALLEVAKRLSSNPALRSQHAQRGPRSARSWTAALPRWRGVAAAKARCQVRTLELTRVLCLGSRF